MAVLVRWDDDSESAKRIEQSACLSREVVVSGTSGNEHGRDADLLCRLWVILHSSCGLWTRDGDTRHGRGWDAKLTVCCPPVQGFDDRRVRMHNALRAGEGVLHGNTLLLA